MDHDSFTHGPHEQMKLEGKRKVSHQLQTSLPWKFPPLGPPGSLSPNLNGALGSESPMALTTFHFASGASPRIPSLTWLSSFLGPGGGGLNDPGPATPLSPRR